MKQHTIAVRLGLSTLVLSALMACSSNQRAGASGGATRGAVGGAAAGAVSALIFGGDVAESAARGAVWAGTAGAVGGAMAGSEADRREAEQARAEGERMLQELRARIGDDAFEGLVALADCKHEVALAYARTAARSTNGDFVLAGVWLEALTRVDADEPAGAEALYAVLVERDPEIGSVEEARSQAVKTIETIRDYREKDGLPRVCR